MTTVLAPASLAELIEMVRGGSKVLAVGARTKPRLSGLEVTQVSTRELRGIVEYEPDEFTFTARSGTPLREVSQTLGERGQYLPFDPMLVESGATLGGTVAAGLSGPGRLRFGGLKDFILGVRFIDGLGRVLRMGGKVVKNAAGFDLPKFFVGSLGRFGVLTELTFKVFPRPVSTRTLRLSARDMESALSIMIAAARSRWEPYALDVLPGGCDVYLALGGPDEAIENIAREILACYPGEVLGQAAAREVWSDLREFKWAHVGGSLVKIVLVPADLRRLAPALQSLDGARLHASAGGNLAFVSLESNSQVTALDSVLQTLSLAAITLRGQGPLWLGIQPRRDIARAVKLALDPETRFPGLDD